MCKKQDSKWKALGDRTDILGKEREGLYQVVGGNADNIRNNIEETMNSEEVCSLSTLLRVPSRKDRCKNEFLNRISPK